MPADPEDFFESKDKRPWSRIKDTILGEYMPAYIAKVKDLRRPLLLIDAFAGPGKTDKGEQGSPLIICKAAETYAKGNYRAIFANKEKKYHEQLNELLKAGGWNTSATSILGDGRDLLKETARLLTNQTVFLYIDPFGLDCEFDTLEPFLKRDKEYSTEILINLSAMGLHRLAAREAYIHETGDLAQIRQWHEKLTRTLGGDYWKEALLADNDLEPKEREQLVVEGYKRRLSSTNYLTYTGSCPVQASRESATKYYMIFASRHPDAMLYLNDGMCKAFNKYMHEQETEYTLFAGQHWTAWRDIRELQNIVVQYAVNHPRRTRKDLWLQIIKDHFMRFTHSEYIKAVTVALDKGQIICETPYPSSIRPTKKLNDNCVLMPI